MGKVITVWGSPGSGKSMFCCILAKALTRDKRKAIIINADMNVPMLPVWLPEQIIQTNTSKSICRKWSYQYDDDIPDNLAACADYAGSLSGTGVYRSGCCTPTP